MGHEGASGAIKTAYDNTLASKIFGAGGLIAKAIGAVKSAWDSIWNTIKGIWDTVSGAILGIYESKWGHGFCSRWTAGQGGILFLLDILAQDLGYDQSYLGHGYP